MNRTRAAGLIAALLATALALTACGKSSNTGSAGNSSSTGNSSSSSSPAQSSGSQGSASQSSGSQGSSSQGSGGGGTVSGSLTIGSANFPESVLLMNIYADALKAKGAQVSTKPNIGAREVYIPALKDGSIDMIPDYSGNLLQYLDATSKATGSDEIYAALPKALGNDLKVLDQSQAQDKDGITVTKATADKYNLKSIGDLAAHSKDMIIGASPEFKTRPYGIPGLKSIYGVEFGKYQTLDSGGPLSVKGLKNGQVDVSDIFTTDPAIKANNFVTLEDPKNMIAAQNVVPVINAKKSDPAMDAVINAVSAKLTTDALVELNTKVAGGADSDQVAQEWLKSVGLG